MTPAFSVIFLIDRVSGSYKIQLTDESDYTGATTGYGFYKITYPDGITVENVNPASPDFTIADSDTELNFRMKNSKFFAGAYSIEQKVYTDAGDFTLVKAFTLAFVEPTLSASNNSAMTTPVVSFLDTTDYVVPGYTSTKTRLFSSYFPTTSDLDGTLKSTSTSELIMVDSGNYYEGIYYPGLLIDAIYSSGNHSVNWIAEKAFTFDVRKFVGYANLLSVINTFKNNIKSGKDEQTYQMIMSLYSHLLAKIASGDTGIQELVAEILTLATGSCGCSSYEYQSGPIVVDEPPSGETTYPFIDQVIYREWTESITFSSTSTIFHRVSGKIRWFKSKQNGNIGNPIFIDGVLNDTWWEEIITGGIPGESECIVRTKFTYEGGAKAFVLPYDPEGIFQFYVAGVLQDKTLYSFAGSIVTFTGSVAVGQIVDIFSTGCDFTFTDISTSDIIRIADFTYSGSSTFTLPESANYIFMVFKNGKKIDPEDFDHAIDSDQFTVLETLDTDIEPDRVTVFYAINKSFYIASFDPLKDVSGGFAANDTAALNLSTVDGLSTTARRSRTRAYVNGGGQGGCTFTYVASGLTANGGTIYNAQDGGFWKRDYDGYVFPEWFGAVGDGVTNDFTALQAAFDTGANVFLNVGKTFAYASQIVIDDRSELIISGKGKLKDLGKVINLTSGTTLTSVGVLIQDCQNIVLDDVTLITSNTSNAQVDTASNSQRVPAIDFQNCKNLKINGINFGGRVGPYVSFASAATDFELMSASFMRVYNCEIVRLTDGRILNNSGAGESFCFNLTSNIFIQNCGFIEETGDKTFGLFKIINCENITVDSLYTKKTSGISSFIDVIGKNFEIRNTHIDNPTGKFLDISREWVEDNESDNISIINCSGNGEGVRSAVTGTKVQRIKRVNIDNLTINTVGTDATLVTATEFDLVTVKNCKLLNPLRLLFYDQVVTAALQNSIVEDFELTASVAASGNTFRLESGAGYQVWRNGLFSFGFFKELRIGDYIGGTGKDLALSRSRFIEFVNVTFQEMTIVLNNNVKFTNCTFRNCAFDFNRSVGSMNTNALVEFTGGEIKYDLNYSRTDGRIFQTFGGLLTAKFAGVNFTGLLHNTGARGLLDNITASANAYSGTWDFKDCLFDIQRWTGTVNAEQQITLLSNSVNSSIPMSIRLSNCRVTDKMFLATFRGATSSGSTNYLAVTLNRVVMESVSVNAFAQTTGTTSLDRCRLTVQNSIFGNEARNRIIAASGNTFNLIRYINNIDSLNTSDI